MIIFKIFLLLYFLYALAVIICIKYNIFKMQDTFISNLMQRDLEDFFRHEVPGTAMHAYIILTVIALLVLLC